MGHDVMEKHNNQSEKNDFEEYKILDIIVINNEILQPIIVIFILIIQAALIILTDMH